jgi:hypothetical protein
MPTEQTEDDHIQEFGIKNYEQPSFYGDCPFVVRAAYSEYGPEFRGHRSARIRFSNDTDGNGNPIRAALRTEVCCCFLNQWKGRVVLA